MDSEAPKSDPPIIKAARIGQHTIITVVCVLGVVVLALGQNWPAETSLMALGALSGLWALGGALGGKK